MIGFWCICPTRRANHRRKLERPRTNRQGGESGGLQRQRLANGPDDPIGPSCDETYFESGPTDAGPVVNEPSQDLEDDSGQEDIQQDHRPIIGPEAVAIIEN
jgi:hypothetical protein